MGLLVEVNPAAAVDVSGASAELDGAGPAVASGGGWASMDVDAGEGGPGGSDLGAEREVGLGDVDSDRAAVVPLAAGGALSAVLLVWFEQAGTAAITTSAAITGDQGRGKRRQVDRAALANSAPCFACRSTARPPQWGRLRSRTVAEGAGSRWR